MRPLISLMRLLAFFVGLILFLTHPSFAAANLRVEFTTNVTQFKWPLSDFAPGLAADWSGYDFLTFDLHASSPLQFDLLIFTPKGTRKVSIQPFQGARTRISVPLAGLQQPPSAGHDLASMSNQSRPSSFISPHGDFGPINAIEAMGVVMNLPTGNPTLEFGNIHLTKGKPEDAVIEPKPLVDEFGQWIPESWPGKARTLAELKQAWAEEEKGLQAGGFNTCQYGGFKDTHARATGFFRVEQIDGRWWLVDPDGHLFFSVGATGMRRGPITLVTGRDGVFAALPADAPRTGMRGDAAPMDRTATTRNNSAVSFYNWNLTRRFGTNLLAPWIDLTMRRMEAWGLNTIGNWSDSRLWDAHRKAYVVNLVELGIEKGFLGLPDVFADDFEKKLDQALAWQCDRRKNDPWLLGYFIANEPAWPWREEQVAQMILSGKPGPAQRKLKEFLAAGDTRARRKEFVYHAFDRFLAMTTAALRRHDPNHLNLGLRFGGSRTPDDVIRACRGLDVFSMNVYRYAPDPVYTARINQLTGRPILIGEFDFGAPGRGLGVGLKQVINQEERGVAYRHYIEQAAALPCLVGAHWFEWIDEPNTGRADGEQFNVGAVDVTDRPYPELVNAFKASHQRLQPVHSAKEPPFSQKARVQ